jgi:hypothetical protein
MTTNNRLNGYDEVVAITQNTINSQFALLCPPDNSGPIASQWQMKDPNDPQQQQGLYVTSMQPPTVSVLQPDHTTFQQGVLSMTLKLTSGELKYYDYGTIASTPIDGWTITFRCPLGNISLQGAEVGSQLSASEMVINALNGYLTKGFFTVMALFTLFEASAVLAAEVSVTGDTALSPNQQSMLLSMLDQYLTGLQSQGTPFILSYALQSRDASQSLPALPMFAPTACEFSDTPNPWNYQSGDNLKTIGLSTVNYLMMTGNRACPDGAAPSPFDFNWITDNQYQGAFGITAALFRSGYVESLLLPILSQGLQIMSGSWQTTGANSYQIQSQWTNHANDNDGKGEKHVADGVEVYEKDSFITSCALTVSSSAGPIVFTGGGSFYAKADFHTYTLGISNDIGWCSAQLDYSFTIELEAGADGTITAACAFTSQPIVTDKHEDPLYSAIDWVVGLFNGDTLKDHLNSSQSYLDSTLTSANSTLSTQTKDALGGLSQTVLLPNGAVFFYKDLEFDDQQNVVMHCTYKN